MARATSRGESNISASTENTVSKTRLKKSSSSGTSPRCSGMVGNWPMYSMGLFQATAVVNLGNNAQIHAMSASLLQNLLNDAALAGRGEENLVDKLLAGILEE